jgi:hypothetical protein
MDIQQWEYRLMFVDFVDPKNGLAKLNQVGGQGWEAVAMSESKKSISVLLKRPASTPSK